MKSIDTIILLAETFAKKAALIEPKDTDLLEVLVYDTKRNRISLGKWQYSTIKKLCPSISKLPGVAEVQADIPGHAGLSWVNGQSGVG